MGLELIKAEHNRHALLIKTEMNKLFHPMMDLLRNSRLSFALRVNPKMYVSTLREFWVNAIVISHNDKPISISSSIQSKPVTITPEILNTHLELQDDATCVESFDKTTMQSAFVDVGYAYTFSKEDTLWKGYLPPPYKYLLHTLMLCFSKKCGNFDQASVHIQELFYSLIKNQKYSLSKYIFRDLIANHYEKSNKFLMYPRFLSFVLSKLLDQNIIEQGDGDYMKSQTVKVFTSMASAVTAPVETAPLVKPTKKSMSSRKRKPAQTPPVEQRKSKRARKAVQEEEEVVPEEAHLDHEPIAKPVETAPLVKSTKKSMSSGKRKPAQTPPVEQRKSKRARKAVQEEEVVVPEEAHLDHEPIAEPQSSAHEPIDFASTQLSPTCGQPVHQVDDASLKQGASLKKVTSEEVETTLDTTTHHQQTSFIVHNRRPSKSPPSQSLQARQTPKKGMYTYCHELVKKLHDYMGERYPGRQETTTSGETEHTGDEESLEVKKLMDYLVSKFAHLSSTSGETEHTGDEGILELEKLIENLVSNIAHLSSEIDELKMQLAEKQEHHTAAAPVAQSNKNL